MSLRETGVNLIEPIRGPKGRLTYSNPNFVKSPEGVAEYKKAGLAYPENAHDKHYNDFLERTPSGSGNPYANKNITRVTDITRRRLTSGKEYLTWHQTEIRYSPLDNPEYKGRTGLGRYPVIEYKNVMVEEESGYRHVVTEPTGNTKTGYSLEYNLKNIDHLHKNASDDYDSSFKEIMGREMRPTHYHLHDERKHMTIAIHNWNDFRDGDFDQLYEFGKKIASEEEAKAIKAKHEKERQQMEEQKLDMLKRSV